jgi:hypothetical protein
MTVLIYISIIFKFCNLLNISEGEGGFVNPEGAIRIPQWWRLNTDGKKSKILKYICRCVYMMVKSEYYE